MQEQVVARFRFSTTIKARLFAQWVPRDLNVTADHLSRNIDDNDWQLEPSLFRHFNAKWGPLTVDRFATHLSAQPPRFNSKWWSPGCEAVDCFTQAWEGEVNWCLPPPALLGDLYAFLANVPCHAVVAFPFWPSAPWWPVWMPEMALVISLRTRKSCLCRLVLSSMCPNQHACLVQTRRLSNLSSCRSAR